jgi:tetratricopeptide (TPR) repeat protein
MFAAKIALIFQLSRHQKHWILWISLPILFWPVTFSEIRADSELRAISDLLQAGEYVTALNILENLKVFRPCDPELLFLEANAYEIVGETEQAVILYRSLTVTFPNFPGPYNNLASLYAARGDLDTAEALLLRGLATNDIYQKIQKNLNKIYISRAATMYRKALGIDLSPNSVETQPLGIQLPNTSKLYQKKDMGPKSDLSICEKLGDTP